MAKKNLSPSTIIPSHLYVERAADRQLRSIIDDMGRPGYVLVARQMGKTNLLINMKRQRHADVVLYFDLSNRFDSARAWFRYVLDSMLEAYPEIFNTAQEVIEMHRRTLKLEPNIEFDRHLRLLLKMTDRRVVIVLDEIDSLVNATYSDTVLAQIRSMYFSRVNYPEYERLTYVLSGVAEPTDLIKDKNISPFNIGEKIYLEDFSRDEFASFLLKADLHLPSRVVDSVFEWAGGSPRMTWDICAVIEDQVLDGRILDIKDVDEIVRALYLESFDRAPVDHIRTLVESDTQIRDAIVSIRYGKSAFLDDKIRSRLYLAGIIRASSGGVVQVKNRIVDLALSEKWLGQLETVRKGLLAAASESYEARNYRQALRQFEEVLAAASGEADFRTIHKVQFAMCLSFANQTARALKILREYEQAERDPEDLQLVRYYIGVVLVLDRAYIEALEVLKLAANGPRIAINQQASISIALSCLRINSATYAKEGLDISKKTIAELLSVEHADKSLLTTAYFTSARLYNYLGDRRSALSELSYALAGAVVQSQPAILMFKYELSADDIERRRFLVSAVSCIFENSLVVDDVTISSLDLTKEVLGKLLARLAAYGVAEEYEKLLAYVQSCVLTVHNAFAVLLELFESIASDEERANNISLVRDAIENFSDVGESQSERLTAFRYLALYARPSRARNWIDVYLRILDEDIAPEAIVDDDLFSFAQLAPRFDTRKDREQLRRFYLVYGKFASRANLHAPVVHLAVRFYELTFYRDNGLQDAGRKLATEVLTLIEQDRDGQISKELASAIPQIRAQASHFLKIDEVARDPFKDFGRNQRVSVRYESDGLIIQRKFKHVSADLKAGRCKLVTV
ncbi:MAG TPA: AAA-like domain-containing protein [Steroidobacteraceae bacterium]|nr:AAA-like domain-containing protein [Steroidobacteraceae bacterium]